MYTGSDLGLVIHIFGIVKLFIEEPLKFSDEIRGQYEGGVRIIMSPVFSSWNLRLNITTADTAMI